jgi:signal transduction histidine kinase
LPPLVVGGLAAVLVALVAQLVAYRVCRATGQLGTEVQRLAEGDFTPVELPRLDDEMRDLAKAVNATAEQLERYQQELRHTEQLRTVGLLGAGIAHELRNAATGCRLAVDLHAEHCPTASDQDGLAVARRQLDLMENRLQRFLQLGKQPAPLKIQRVDLPRLVDEYVAMVAPLARHAGVELNWQIPSEPRWVSADSGILGQAVANLLLNAVEAAQKQAAATAFSNRDTTGQVVVQCSKQGEAGVELEIADTGAGPGAEVAGRLFDPFVTSKQEGVGLGLAVAKQVIDAHHGSIQWRRVDGWTRFRVWLPHSAEERN